MTVDSMSRLAAANPVLDPPAVESPERLRRLIEDDAPSLDGRDEFHRSSSANRRSRVRRRALVAAALCAAASVIGVLLTSGSSGPGVNVAAASYAATSPRAGIVEAVFVTRIFRGSQAGGTLRQREWLDSAAGMKREQDSTTGPYGDTRETHVLETVSAPGRVELWSAGREANTVTRLRAHGDTRFNMAFGGIPLTGLEGIKLYRQLYLRGGMALVGRERYQGRLLWKLESRPFTAANNGRKLAVATHTKLIVLVDPKTFLPVNERQVDVALPGHPTLVESNLLSYGRYVGGQSEGRLFDLAAQHPRARVLTSNVRPRFVSMHRPRHTHTARRVPSTGMRR
jgi:hypothetical protein